MLPEPFLADSEPVEFARVATATPESREIPRAVRKTLDLCRQLLSERGEVSGAKVAAEVLAAVAQLDQPLRECFFDQLASGFAPDAPTVQAVAQAYLSEPSPTNLLALQSAADPVRNELFRRLNLAKGGTTRLVDLRRELLTGANRHWMPVAAGLEKLFTDWFNRGFLELRRIDWNSSAQILEKVIQYEAVHEVQGWDDLRRRLAGDRRCYAFFHPALPGEPIIFIEVALTRGMSTRVQPLLDPSSAVRDPQTADTAVFYSITNCQEGLRGVPFGSFLIKQVAEDLGSEFPGLRHFVTLSPVPGFRGWLKRTMPADDRFAHLTPMLDDFSWTENADALAIAEETFLPLCAYYLARAKSGDEPLDPVARFHLRNGARLERINWLADTSAAGMDRSLGIMVNYHYRIEDVERNHEAYSRERQVVCAWQVESAARKLARR